MTGLTLGTHSKDLTHRALLTVPVTEHGIADTSHTGADLAIVELGAISPTRVTALVRDLSDRVSIPVAIETGDPDLAGAGFDAGAVAVYDMGCDPRLASVCASAGASLILVAVPPLPGRRPERRNDDPVASIMRSVRTRLETAHAAGIDPRRTAIEVDLGSLSSTDQALLLLPCVERLKELGRPVGVSVERPDLAPLTGDDHAMEVDAATAVAVAAGARLVRTTRIRETRRILDTLAEISSARSSDPRP